MNELYEQIQTVHADLNVSKHSDETRLIVFRGFLLELLAKSYGYSSYDDWHEALQEN